MQLARIDRYQVASAGPNYFVFGIGLRAIGLGGGTASSYGSWHRRACAVAETGLLQQG
jgi:hypothetical protein